MSRRKITHEENYKGYKVNQSEQGLIVEILQAVDDRLKYLMQKGYSQISAAHMDVTIPDTAANSKPLSSVAGESLTKLKERYKRNGIDCQGIWCQEVSANRTDQKPHIHMAVMWDSSKGIQSGWTVANDLNKLITRRLNIPAEVKLVHVNPPQKGDPQAAYNQAGTLAIKLRQNKPGAEAQKANIFERFSYLAKEHTKSNIPDGTRRYGATAIPKGS